MSTERNFVYATWNQITGQINQIAYCYRQKHGKCPLAPVPGQGTKLREWVIDQALENVSKGYRYRGRDYMTRPPRLIRRGFIVTLANNWGLPPEWKERALNRYCPSP